MANGTGAGVFVPTTFIFDLERLQEVDVTSADFKELLVRLYTNLNVIALSLNVKDSGYYTTDEFVTGQLFFPSTVDSTTAPHERYRPTFRKIVNFGALPNTATKSVAHGITVTTAYIFTRIYGCASNTTAMTYLPIPNVSTNIHLDVDATNVNITTGGNLSAYATTYVVLEYLK